eukprot:scaffold1102_cov256-Pinguiococcus_pyrenoidosus.AAC.5
MDSAILLQRSQGKFVKAAYGVFTTLFDSFAFGILPLVPHFCSPSLRPLIQSTRLSIPRSALGCPVLPPYACPSGGAPLDRLGLDFHPGISRHHPVLGSTQTRAPTRWQLQKGRTRRLGSSLQRGCKTPRSLWCSSPRRARSTSDEASDRPASRPSWSPARRFVLDLGNFVASVGGRHRASERRWAIMRVAGKSAARDAVVRNPRSLPADVQGAGRRSRHHRNGVRLSRYLQCWCRAQGIGVLRRACSGVVDGKDADVVYRVLEQRPDGVAQRLAGQHRHPALLGRGRHRVEGAGRVPFHLVRRHGIAAVVDGIGERHGEHRVRRDAQEDPRGRRRRLVRRRGQRCRHLRRAVALAVGGGDSDVVLLAFLETGDGDAERTAAFEVGEQHDARVAEAHFRAVLDLVAGDGVAAVVGRRREGHHQLRRVEALDDRAVGRARRHLRLLRRRRHLRQGVANAVDSEDPEVVQLPFHQRGGPHVEGPRAAGVGLSCHRLRHGYVGRATAVRRQSGGVLGDGEVVGSAGIVKEGDSPGVGILCRRRSHSRDGDAAGESVQPGFDLALHGAGRLDPPQRACGTEQAIHLRRRGGPPATVEPGDGGGARDAGKTEPQPVACEDGAYKPGAGDDGRPICDAAGDQEHLLETRLVAGAGHGVVRDAVGGEGEAVDGDVQCEVAAGHGAGIYRGGDFPHGALVGGGTQKVFPDGEVEGARRVQLRAVLQDDVSAVGQRGGPSTSQRGDAAGLHADQNPLRRLRYLERQRQARRCRGPRDTEAEGVDGGHLDGIASTCHPSWDDVRPSRRRHHDRVVLGAPLSDHRVGGFVVANTIQTVVAVVDLESSRRERGRVHDQGVDVALVVGERNGPRRRRRAVVGHRHLPHPRADAPQAEVTSGVHRRLQDLLFRVAAASSSRCPLHYAEQRLVGRGHQLGVQHDLVAHVEALRVQEGHVP